MGSSIDSISGHSGPEPVNDAADNALPVAGYRPGQRMTGEREREDNPITARSVAKLLDEKKTELNSNAKSVLTGMLNERNGDLERLAYDLSGIMKGLRNRRKEATLEDFLRIKFESQQKKLEKPAPEPFDLSCLPIGLRTHAQLQTLRLDLLKKQIDKKKEAEKKESFSLDPWFKQIARLRTHSTEGMYSGIDPRNTDDHPKLGDRIIGLSNNIDGLEQEFLIAQILEKIGVRIVGVQQEKSYNKEKSEVDIVATINNTMMWLDVKKTPLSYDGKARRYEQHKKQKRIASGPEHNYQGKSPIVMDVGGKSTDPALWKKLCDMVCEIDNGADVWELLSRAQVWTSFELDRNVVYTLELGDITFVLPPRKPGPHKVPRVKKPEF